MTIDFTTEAAALSTELIELRRDLHRNPELGLDLPRTQRAILDALDGLPLEITTGKGLSSVIAVLRGGRPGPTILLRGDMDALPVVETTGLDYASTNGNMHACGHDLHVSGLVGAAKLLSAHQDELAGTVAFMFQPGEEGLGGAKDMIDEGMFDTIGSTPDAAYAIHVAPGEPGTFVTRPGTIMAGANTFHLTMHGKGGHSSRPQDAVDPIRPLLEFGQAVYSMVTGSFSVFDPIVAEVTQLNAGSAVNIIPGTASLAMSVRTLSAETTKRFPELATRLAESIAAAHRCTAEVVWNEQYPVTVNDAAEAAFTVETLQKAFGPDRVVEAPDPVMGSEDFSYVLEEVPGAFVFLFVTPDGVDPETAAVNHSPEVLFDDAHLPDQAAALATLAWERSLRG
ncbi:M20 metallopeptidase family protein [Brevibacterium casei]|uniref:M20 metallopeptidase family protein n=1 Tax=Brevibacterium casei TaxID=33889 RepID=UPI00103A871B|nr:M20 family metallopeptidase [Brevibacterium casei]MCT1764799.1 M20 family metallopeptidase [Brevibacterium casei]MCT2359112.1 M20 family metallopeptidase [Brevibacterium casei]